MATATLDQPQITRNEDGEIILDAATFDPAIHDGMVTIHNMLTGQHRTFKIETKPEDASFAPGKRVLSLLRGSDREDWSSWTAFGFVERTGRAYAWKKFAGTDYAKFARMIEQPARYTARGCEYMVEARCRRCRRPLTHPESVATGLGPICAGR